MEIIRAEVMGFCSGVKRAVDLAENALCEQQNGTVFTMGPLIHNSRFLAKLAERGLTVLDDGDKSRVSKNDTVIIRAHGVSPELSQEIRKIARKFVDATCPLVKQSQKRASEYARRGYQIFFAGDSGHGECTGIEGFVKEAARKSEKPMHFFVVKNEDELASFFDSGKVSFEKDAVLLSQTTFSSSVFEKIKEKFSERFPSAKVVCSICPATSERQKSLEKLCAQVDGVLVVGGKISANTNRLFSTAQKLCGKSALIESADEIPAEFFLLQKVGITAGASTPEESIFAVEESLKSNSI